jgi:hypothetical protein
VSSMLAVAALEISHPMRFLILVEPDNAPLHKAKLVRVSREAVRRRDARRGFLLGAAFISR